MANGTDVPGGPRQVTSPAPHCPSADATGMTAVPSSLQPYACTRHSPLLGKRKALAGFAGSAEGSAAVVSPREDPHARSHGSAGRAERGQSTGRERWCWLLGQGPARTPGGRPGQPRQTGTDLPALLMALGLGAASAEMAADPLLMQPGSWCTAAAPHPKGGKKEALATRKCSR